MQQQSDDKRNRDADRAAKRGTAVELRPVNTDGRSENIPEYGGDGVSYQLPVISWVRSSSASRTRFRARSPTSLEARNWKLATVSVGHERVSALSILERIGEFGWIGPVSVEAAAIHEECRGCRDATAHAGVDISLNPPAHCGCCEVVGYRNGIDADRSGILDQIIGLQRILILVQKSMHGPEGLLTAAPSDGFGCLRSSTRVRILISNREISENEPDVIADVFKHLLKNQMGKAALRILVVTVLDQRDRRVCPPPRVIVRPNGHCQYRR